MLQIEGVHFFVYHSINGMNFFCITSISDQACHSLWVSPEVVVTMKFIVRILKHFEIEKGTIAKKNGDSYSQISLVLLRETLLLLL